MIGTWQLQDGDVKTRREFAVPLRNDRSPLSGYLFARLRVSDALQNALIDELNKQINGPSLYEKCGLPLPDDLRTSEKRLSRKALMKLNRQLLERLIPARWQRSRIPNLFSRLLGIKPKKVIWLLKTADITDLTGFAHKLLENHDPVSQYLNSQFSEETRKTAARIRGKECFNRRAAAILSGRRCAPDITD